MLRICSLTISNMSKAFEFHFNPAPIKHHPLFTSTPTRLSLEQGKIHRIPFFARAQNPSTIFDTFCFFPETRQENKLGALYLMGEIKNVLPGAQNILPEIARVVKEEYYQFAYQMPQDCFRAALEKADEHLLELKKRNTDFLGNLSFTAIALLPDFSVSISKMGDCKLFLLTGKNIFDIGDNFDSSQSPIRTFPNVVEGSLERTDKIIAITDQLFDVFYEQEIFHALIDIKRPKKIKELFKQKKPALTQAYGCCLLILVKREWPRLFLKPSFTRPSPPAEGWGGSPFSKIVFSFLLLALLLTLGWLIF